MELYEEPSGEQLYILILAVVP